MAQVKISTIVRIDQAQGYDYNVVKLGCGHWRGVPNWPATQVGQRIKCPACSGIAQNIGTGAICGVN